MHEQWIYQRLHKIEKQLMTTHLGLFELVTLCVTSIVLSQNVDHGLSGYGIIYCLFVIVGVMAIGTISDAVTLIHMYRKVRPMKWIPNCRPWVVTLIGIIFPQFGVCILLFLGLLLLLAELTGSVEIAIAIPVGMSVFIAISLVAAGLTLLRVRYFPI
ncbi:hypothetical protein GL50803_0010667 [Giardia duodenalis]|uniref:Uncharacterized protein n=1 Tax=Giardia intestinalis (strain ATCC 50803 / WB clone C6) TaxID=184922 RepID=A8BBP0_GIAIC|nr:hypothetical protein GL50803_0010667 [Giardia intestinalis]KAE8305269.1 hypothetical protein GL50803_0010667 [Giardia intestinalis]|eukprot:XP_001708025.1 Hypothetical protein GL50803_10667 [Giardia lamblia ATCC 50803]